MSGQGTNLAEERHIVNVLPPISVAGGVTGDRFRMKHHGHASIIIQLGVTAEAAEKIIVRECDAATGGTVTDIAFNVYKEETDGGDTLGARTEVAATGLTPVDTDNIFYVIEIDARELSDGYEWIEVAIQAGTGASILCSIVAVLSGARFANDQNQTAIA